MFGFVRGSPVFVTGFSMLTYRHSVDHEVAGHLLLADSSHRSVEGATDGVVD